MKKFNNASNKRQEVTEEYNKTDEELNKAMAQLAESTDTNEKENSGFSETMSDVIEEPVASQNNDSDVLREYTAGFNQQSGMSSVQGLNNSFQAAAFIPFSVANTSSPMMG